MWKKDTYNNFIKKAIPQIKDYINKNFRVAELYVYEADHLSTKGINIHLKIYVSYNMFLGSEWIVPIEIRFKEIVDHFRDGYELFYDFQGIYLKTYKESKVNHKWEYFEKAEFEKGQKEINDILNFLEKLIFNKD